MALNAGTVAAYLTLDTCKFKTGIEEANQQLRALRDSELTATKRVQGLGSALTSIGSSLTRSLTLPLVGAGATSVKFASDYESAFAGVRKTVDATEEEYQRLSDSILDMSKRMPPAATEIAGVMEAAGQLGIQKNSLESFTETMVMLGDSTNLSANEAASALAKFANVTNMSADDYGRLGSTIVELGNNFATTEADVVAMGTRLASTGNLVGLSQPQIMAVATALSSCGIEAEAGGSAVSKLLKQIDVAAKTFDKSGKVIDTTGYSLRELELMADQDSKSFKGVAASLGMTTDELKNCMEHVNDLQDFSDVAGVSAEAFKKAWSEDAVGALGMFIDGLNDTERNGRSAVEILDEMDIKEVRLSNAVLSLASSQGILNRSVDMANGAWEENTALSHEAGQRYETFASQCAMLWNRVKALGIEVGNELIPTVKDLMGTAEGILSWFSSLDSGTKRMIVNAGMIAAAVGPVTLAFGKLTTGVGGLMSTVTGAVSAFTAAGGGLAGFGSALVSVVTPAGLVVAAMTALTAVGVALYLSAQNAHKGTEALGKAMSDTADYADAFTQKLHTSSDKVSDFASTLSGGFDMNDIKAKISEVQGNITKITSLASNQRRKLTQKEIDKLDEYYQKLRELTEQELAYYENNLGALQTIIANDFDMTADNAKKVLSEAQSYKEESLSLAWQAYEEEVALIAKKYDKESEEFQKGKAQAKQHYDERIAIINDSYAEITSAVAGAYAEQNVLDSDFYSKLTQYNSDVEAENQRHHDHILEIQKDFIGDASTMSAALYQENREHQRNIDALNQSMADSFNSSSQQIVGTLIALLDEMQTNDGQMTAETRTFVEEFLACYDTLPADLQETMSDAVAGLRQALENGKPDVKQAAALLAQVIPDTAKMTLEEHSPSRVMYQIGGFAMEGLENGMESRRGSAVSLMGSIVNGIKTAASAVSFVSVGEHIIGGMLSGINARKQSLLDTAGGIASRISTTFKSALKIQSPSRVMMEIGRYTTEGMELGLAQGSEGLYQTASMIASDTADALAGLSSASHLSQDYGAAAVGGDTGSKLDRLLEAVEKLADAQTAVEIDGRPFGRLVREYV